MSGQFVKRLTRNPWVVISVMGHLLVLAIISVIVVVNEQAEEDTAVTSATIAKTQETVEEKPPEVVDREEIPKLQDEEIEPNELQEWVDQKDPNPAEQNVDPSLANIAPGDTTGGSAIGIAGPGHHGFAPSAFGGRKPGGGKFGNRFGGKGRPGGQQTAQAVRDGLLWLKNHQDQDGRWDADNFMKHDKEGEPCDGPGNPTNDVGLTGLALLAFLGEGNTLRTGYFKDTVRRAVRWLQEQQDPNTGLFGDQSTHDYIYSHAIAALAMCEAYGLSQYEPIKKCAQNGIKYIQNARNPYGVWRYQPQDGDNDTSVTGWMVLSLVSAKEFKLTIDEQALTYSLTWLDQVTDPATGRAGYTQKGERSSRHAHLQAKFPADKTESLTAVGLLCRFFLGQDPKDTPVMTAAAETLLKLLPSWDPKAGTIDYYYWYYGSFAMYQMGGRHWDTWNRKMTDAVLKSQRMDGNFKGSWDAVDAWGEDGGRVYSTATMVLCLEVYYRYSRVLGGR